VTAGAVALTSILVPDARHQVIIPSALAGSFGPPQVTGVLSSIAFSPDGKTLAVGSSGGLKSGSGASGTYLLDVASGNRITTLSPGGGAEAFSSDGTMLATAGGLHNRATYVWDVADQRKIATLDDRTHSSVEAVSFSPDGKELAANDTNGEVFLWSVARRHEVATVSPPGAVASNAVAFSPRGTTLAMGGSDGQVYLLNSANDHPAGMLFSPGDSGITSVEFSPNGKELAASEIDGVTYVWNLADQRRVLFADPDTLGIESVAFSPNGKWLATGDDNGKTFLWNLAAKNKHKPTVTLTNPKSSAAAPLAGDSHTPAISVAFSPDGKTLATTDTNGYAYLWTVP
jgi:WD40 repeat protein